MGNYTCPVETKPQDPVPFWENGQLNFKAHDVGWIIAGFFTIIASVASFWLIWKHLTYFTCPQQQRHIVRMLIMVPIYAVVSFLSYFFFTEAIYYSTIRDCYEAVVITSFFYLLMQYVGDTPEQQEEVFRKVTKIKWMFPLNPWNYNPGGLHFMWLMKICILQYAIVRPVCTLAAVGLQYYGMYCLESWALHFGHIWISIAISISVSVAMYCIIQFYMPIKAELAPYSPILKFLAVKSVVFLTFWQDSFLSLLVSYKVIKESEYMTAAEIQVGLNALLETFEMCIFAFLHIKAFTYLVYRPEDRKRVTKRGKAFLHCMDFRDWFFEMKVTTKYVAAKSRGRDYSIVDNIREQKYKHLENALGRDRNEELDRERELEIRAAFPTFWKEELPADDESETEVGPGSLKSELAKPLIGPMAGMSRRELNATARELDEDEKYGGQVDDDGDEAEMQPLRPTLSYGGGGGGDAKDSHPELAHFHVANQPLNLAVGSPRGFADELENEYRARGIWDGQSEAGTNVAGYGAGGVEHRKEHSWWRSMKERLSGSIGDGQPETRFEAVPTHIEEDDHNGDWTLREKAASPRQTAPSAPSPPSPAGSNSAGDSIRGSRHSPLAQFINTLSASPTQTDRFTPLPERPSVGRRSSMQADRRLDDETRVPPYELPASPPPPVRSVSGPQQPQMTLARQDSIAAASSKQGSISGYAPTSNDHSNLQHYRQQAMPPASQSAGYYNAVPPLATPRSKPSITFAPSLRDQQQGVSNAQSRGRSAEVPREQVVQRDRSVSRGPKGKPIAIVVPPRLSGETPRPSIDSQSAYRSSTDKRASLTREQARQWQVDRDDPERVKPKVTAQIVAGGASLAQWRAEQEARQTSVPAPAPAPAPAAASSSGSANAHEGEPRLSQKELQRRGEQIERERKEKEKARRKGRGQPEEPMVTIPAPSQLGDAEGAFGAAAAAQRSGTADSLSSPVSALPSQPVRSYSGGAPPPDANPIQVGAIVPPPVRLSQQPYGPPPPHPRPYPTGAGIPPQSRQMYPQQQSRRYSHSNAQQQVAPPAPVPWPAPSSQRHQGQFVSSPRRQSGSLPRPRRSSADPHGAARQPLSPDEAWAREQRARDAEYGRASRQPQPASVGRKTGFQFEYVD